MTVDNDFEKFLTELQKKVDYEEESIFSKKVIHEYRNPTNFGVLVKPDKSGTIKGPCGDTMRIDLQLKKDIITNARFWTDGCGPSIACGNMLTKIVLGKNLKEANTVTSKQLISALDGLPEENLHCAVLAVNTLRKSIKNYYKRK